MAKDGTARGGQRVGAGRKPKALADKVTQGSAANVLDFPVPEDLEGADVPPVKEYLRASQKVGIDLCAEDVFKSAFLWLKERGCDRFVKTYMPLFSPRMTACTPTAHRRRSRVRSVCRWTQRGTRIRSMRTVSCTSEVPATTAIPASWK